MLDLAILLSLAFVITATLGLLLAGFVWTPWLIGLVLIGLLVALLKLANLAPVEQLVEQLVEPLPTDERLASQTNPADQPSEPTHDSTSEPVMVYRGVKYQHHETDPTEPAAPPNVPQEGLYRGQRWKRSP